MAARPSSPYEGIRQARIMHEPPATTAGIRPSFRDRIARGKVICFTQAPCHGVVASLVVEKEALPSPRSRDGVSGIMRGLAPPSSVGMNKGFFSRTAPGVVA
jgi:hypothetical protein